MSDLAGVEGFTPGHETTPKRLRICADVCTTSGDHAFARRFGEAADKWELAEAELSRLRTALEEVMTACNQFPHGPGVYVRGAYDAVQAINTIAREALRPALEGEKT